MMARTKSYLSLWCLLGALCSPVKAVTPLVSVKVDTIQPGDLTIVLQDFNGAPPTVSYSNNANRPNMTQVGVADGYGTYQVTPSTETPGDPYPVSPQHDPRMTFQSVPFDVHEYNYIRTRQSYEVDEGVTLSKAPGSELWPNAPVGPTRVNFGNLNQTFTEYRSAWADPTNSSIKTATDGGFRWDPVVTGITTDAAIRFNLDYFMVDRGRVVGYEFDTTGSHANGHTLGWSPTRVTDGTYLTENGILKGTTSANDPYLIRSGINIDTSVYKFAEIRMKMSTSTELQFFWATSVSTSFSEDKSVKVNTDGQWHTYLLDFTQETSWQGNLTQFRIDVGSTGGLGFEIDYVRFREIGAVPEPTRSLLVSLAVGAILLRRTRVS